MFSESVETPELADPYSALGDIAITIEAELDRTNLAFIDVAKWVPGSLVRLPNSAGETISIHAGGVCLGTGEVIVVDGVLTVRVSDLASMPEMPDRADDEEDPRS